MAEKELDIPGRKHHPPCARVVLVNDAQRDIRLLPLDTLRKLRIAVQDGGEAKGDSGDVLREIVEDGPVGSRDV